MPATNAILTTHTAERRRHLRAALASLPDGLPAVVVVPDRRLAPTADAHGDLRIVVDERADSLSRARNIGAKAADSRYYAFLDDDVQLAASWWPAAQRHASRDVVACGGPAVPAFPRVGRPAYLPRRFDWLIGCGPYFTTCQRVRNTYGCNLVVRADAFDGVGGFDDSLGKAGDLGQGEETDLCRRLAGLTGDRVVYEPAMVVHHRVFEQQLRLTHLLRRAYHQGKTKAAIGIDDAERGFLRETVADLAGQSPAAGLGTLAFTAATGLGYATGRLRR